MNGRTFAVVTRDELWSFRAGPILLDQRLIHGTAVWDSGGIRAADALDEELDQLCASAMESARETILAAVTAPARPSPDAVRLITSCSREAEETRTSVSCAMTARSLSLISDPLNIEADARLLAALAARKPEVEADYRSLPILWRNGSAAVLLHEAAGHPAELSHEAISWPGWLRVSDGSTDLLRGEKPEAMRRASFSDVPLPRMTELVVQQNAAPFSPPLARIEIHLVSGGTYEPLDEMVTLEVAAADLVDGNSARPLRPFVIRESRRAVAKALAGATGSPTRYPGVVCSKEGQDVVVGSAAPLILTLF